MTLEQEREVQVAIVAAENALEHLEAARERLGSARSWGVWDLVGGGLLSTMIKHSRMDDAQRELGEACRALRTFSAELVELDAMEGVDLETGDLLGLADYFLDGALADWMMQSRIRRAQEQVDEAIRKVQDMHRTLETMLEEG